MNQYMDMTSFVPPPLGAIAGDFQKRLLFLSGAPADWAHSPVEQCGGDICWTARRDDGVEARMRLRVSPADRVGVLRTTLVNTAGAESRPVPPAICMTMKLADQGEPYMASVAAGGEATGEYPPAGSFRTFRARIDASFWTGCKSGGRSSDHRLPFTVLCDKTGAGVWFGMEWSGLWSHYCTANADGTTSATLFLNLGERWMHYLVTQPDFTMNVGEVLELAPVHFGFFDGGIEEGPNAVRRYLRQRICPPLAGAPVLPHLAYDHWFGVEEDFDEPFLRAQADRAAELGLEYFVLDAGWFDGGFRHGAGNWFADPEKFPQGIRPFADYVRSKGLKFGLFHEPERANRGSEWVRRHPELFIDIGNESLLLDLSRPAAQDLLIDHFRKLITELDVRWIRWDLNVDIGLYWREADKSARIQLAYCRGLYRVLDEIKSAFPQLVHENCASGGRRIDLGMLGYAHSSWISDTTIPPDSCHFIQSHANVFLPAHLCSRAVVVKRGQGDDGFGDYDVLSRMAGSLLFSGDIASWSAGMTRQMKNAVDVFREIRPILCGDYYRLLPSPVEPDDWDAGQFIAGDRGRGVVFVFRPAGGDDLKTVRLKQLLPDVRYRVISRYGVEQSPQIRTGRDLMQDGLLLRFLARGACLLSVERQ
jgi:alpha-galactosidase